MELREQCNKGHIPATMAALCCRGASGDPTADGAWLVSGELVVWVALRRVNEGGVTVLEGAYYHHGRAVPCYLAAPLTELIEIEFLTVNEPLSDMAGMQRVTVTDRGQKLYEMLCGTRGVPALMF